MESVITRLEEAARADPLAAPLARLTAEAFRAGADPAWDRAVPSLRADGLADGRPVLAGAVIAMDRRSAGTLLEKLSMLASSGASDATPDMSALPDPLALIQASINQDGEWLKKLAVKAGAGVELVATLGHLVALPLLQACGRRAESLLENASWERGYCPVCAAWPVIGEVRGVERQRWLRCGRCGAGWRYFHRVCSFCGNNDHLSQGYLSSDEGREARQATTCERCRGYLKNVASPLVLDPVDVILKDLSTLELDAAAIERGYGKPEAPGYSLEVRIGPE